MPLFRSKKVVIEARHFAPETNPEAAADIIEWCGAETKVDGGVVEHVIRTLEGPMTVSEGDYVIKGLVGEFYPCKPDVFHQKYEPLFEGECSDGDWEKQEENEEPPGFEQELCALINKHSVDAKMNMPDFVLADYIGRCLMAMNQAIFEAVGFMTSENEPDVGETSDVVVVNTGPQGNHSYSSEDTNKTHVLDGDCWCNPIIEKVEGKK